jgi:xylan 1,4-beta-xylosidase
LNPKNKFQAMNAPIITVDSDTLNHGWERRIDGRRPWIEGSWANKVNGKYYLQYAAAGTELDWYSDGFYVSNDPMKGFKFDMHNPFSMKPTGFVRGAGHSSTFADKKNNYWHIVTNCLSVKNSYERRLSLFPTLFDKDGVPYCCTLWGDYPQRMPLNKFSNPEDLFTGWMLLSYNKPAKASSTMSGHSVEYAFDENMKTYWSSNGNKGEWIQIDLKGLKKVYAIQINFADQDVQFKGLVRNKGHKYRILTSENGLQWKCIVNKSSSQKDTPHDYVELPKL